MDSTAIKEIAALSAAQLAQREIIPGSAVVIPDGYNLNSLEPLQPEPNRFRGHFNTTVLNQFIDYIDQHGSADTGVFIDHVSMTAKAIIDQGNQSNPLWGKHTAAVALNRTPAYEALNRLNDNLLNQQAFIDFAEDWQDNVLFYYGDFANASAESFRKTIQALRTLKTSATASTESEINNFSASRSAMESIEVSAGAYQPPTGFLFNVIPYDGFDSVSFDCQVRAITEGKEVKLKYRISKLEQHREHIAEQFKDKIVTGIKADDIKIFIGHMEYQK